MNSLDGKTLFITGASRGIGRAIAVRAARDGANVVVAAKTEEPHPKLPGTIYTVADEIGKAGGEPLPLAVDIRDESKVKAAMDEAVARFGGIDILVNNASAINLRGTLDIPIKRFDLMHQVDARGTWVCSKLCLPHLLKSKNPHILTLSPPLSLEPRFFGPHLAYTMAKFGMSLCVLGMAEEFKGKVAVNALWPKTTIATAAVRNLLGGEEMIRRSRKPEIVADAAHAILTRPAAECSGNFFIDEEVLAAEGVQDFSSYAVDPGAELMPDLFL
ncbi:MAG: NAD(P)-dependent oxidoreductase [Acidobacteriota bacterium]